jgi:ribosomal-protein-alanine N-acetyltransferase
MNNLDNIFNQFPIIKLDDIILRQIIPERDYQRYFDYLNKPQVAAYLSSEDLPNSLDAAKIELNYWAGLFNYHASFYWAVVSCDTDQIIGTCGFNHWNKSQCRAEISYDLDHNYWGKGIMAKAVKAITNFGLNDMQLHRIQATVAIDNISSIKMLEKVGFNRESLLQTYGVLHGIPKDFYMYTLIRK